MSVKGQILSFNIVGAANSENRVYMKRLIYIFVKRQLNVILLKPQQLAE